MTVLEAIRALRVIHAERGDVELVIRGNADWPPEERSIERIDEAPPYDEHERYDPRWRAAIFPEE